jgi:hypothetical protein
MTSLTPLLIRRWLRWAAVILVGFVMPAGLLAYRSDDQRRAEDAWLTWASDENLALSVRPTFGTEALDRFDFLTKKFGRRSVGIGLFDEDQALAALEMPECPMQLHIVIGWLFRSRLSKR